MKCKLIVYPSLNPKLNMTLIYIISSLYICLTFIRWWCMIFGFFLLLEETRQPKKLFVTFLKYITHFSMKIHNWKFHRFFLCHMSYCKESKSSKARANIHLLLRNSLGRPLFENGTCIMDHMIYDLWQYSSQSLIGGLWFMIILNLTISWRKMEYTYILDSKFISHIH